MNRVFKCIVFVFLFLNVKAAKNSEDSSYRKNFENFYALDYNITNINNMINLLKKNKNKKNKFANSERILLNEFMTFVDYNHEKKNVKSEYSCKIKECCGFEMVIKEYISKIISTDSGKFLICSLLHLMYNNKSMITFKVVNDGKGITTNGGVISIDLSHFFSSTDFYICAKNGLICKENQILPDVYLFHELLHYKHYLEDRKKYEELDKGIFSSDMDKFNEKLKDLCIDFPGGEDRLYVDYEEMRTIIGVPFEQEDRIICENSYRREKGYPSRYNLLDAGSETASKKNLNKIYNLIEKASEVYY